MIVRKFNKASSVEKEQGLEMAGVIDYSGFRKWAANCLDKKEAGPGPTESKQIRFS